MPLATKIATFLILLSAAFLLSSESKAQKLDTVSTFSITTYIDAYYAYYTDSVGLGNNQKFPTVSPRSNTPSLNIMQVSLNYSDEKIRATGVLHFGDMANALWPHPYNNIMEAHVGFKVYSKLWIDAGFFRSHFGTEFILPVENLTSSVTVATAYEPAYESGVRLNFDPTKKLEINLFLLNGYNIFVDNNNKKSFGMGVTYALGDHGNIGYTNYIGDDSPPGSISHLRIDQNLFVNYQYHKIKLQAGGDYCLQQNADIATGSKYATMYSALATIKYQATHKFSVYARGEIFEDPDGFMSTIITDNTGQRTGYKLWGVTAGMEYKPTEESYVRLEGRRLQMDHDQYIFNYNGYLYNTRYEVMVNAGVTFDLLRRLTTRVSNPPEATIDD